MQPIEESKDETDPENCGDEVFNSEEHMRRSLSRFCYADLFVIGKIWIQSLKTVLVGAKLCLIPVVNAVKPPEPPQKPPPMKYTDLPLYRSPHYEYKDYISDRDKCPDYKVKLLHQALLPYVSEYRKKTQECMGNACTTLSATCEDVCRSISSTKRDFKTYMRCSDNLQMRQGVVVSGTLTGFLLGGGGGIPRRVLFTAIGALSTGALCFPKETDEYFRGACYLAAKGLIAIYNCTCGKEFSLRERMPCKDEMPPPPGVTKPLCPKK